MSAVAERIEEQIERAVDAANALLQVDEPALPRVVASIAQPEGEEQHER